jgi:hypothetical protein
MDYKEVGMKLFPFCVNVWYTYKVNKIAKFIGFILITLCLNLSPTLVRAQGFVGCQDYGGGTCTIGGAMGGINCDPGYQPPCWTQNDNNDCCQVYSQQYHNCPASIACTLITGPTPTRAPTPTTGPPNGGCNQPGYCDDYNSPPFLCQSGYTCSHYGGGTNLPPGCNGVCVMSTPLPTATGPTPLPTPTPIFQTTPIPRGNLCDIVSEANKAECARTCADSNHVWTAIGCVPTDLTGFFKIILSFGLGIAGGIAFLLIILGGFQIMTSAGNPEQLEAGKELITSAITGLLLIVFSTFILRLIGFDILGIPSFH